MIVEDGAVIVNNREKMKTIRLIAALLLFLTAGLCMAQNSSKPDVTWKEPSTGFDSSDSAFRIKEVRFYKDL